MQTFPKLTLLCGAAAALLSGLVAATPASAKGYDRHDSSHKQHVKLSHQQHRDFEEKRSDIRHEDASVRNKQHKETERFHAQDARLHEKDLAYRAAHHGQLSGKEAARLDRQRQLDKERELTAQHRATYKAEYNKLRATRRYDDQKARLLRREGR